MNFTIIDPKKKKLVTVGSLVDDTLYITKTNKKHMVWKYKGYGIQQAAFPELLKRGVKHIIIGEKDTGKEFKTTMQTWIDKGIVDNLGHGEQRFLAVEDM
jgi:hypothetical protein